MNIDKLLNSQIMSLTTDELAIMPKLISLAKEAQDAAKLVRESISFKIGEERAEVYRDRDGNNFEYVTVQGVWQARYLHQKYDILCDAESIFKLYTHAYLYEVSKDMNLYEESLIAGYFKSFIHRLARAAEEGV
ncbi:MAG: hypothetical protein IJ217_05665 [Clostridia bacterium]|nr:hypothetical protein [Clostridia bacterium]